MTTITNMKPPALSTLRKKASASTSARGHRLKWGAPYGRPAVPHLGAPHENFSQTGRCKCGMEVTINQCPAPNGIGIGGEAVALNCTR
jgi:hypothetical protein